MRLLNWLLRLLVEFSARKLSYDDLHERLRLSQDRVASHLRAAPTTPGNVEAARHIIGLERWGINRLRSVLEAPDSPPIMDEYDSYRPEQIDEMSHLADAFVESRRALLGLVDQFKADNIEPTRKIPHNQIGLITVRGWLRYLNDHATRELSRIRD